MKRMRDFVQFVSANVATFHRFPWFVEFKFDKLVGHTTDSLCLVVTETATPTEIGEAETALAAIPEASGLGIEIIKAGDQETD
jgi:dihydropteroate synthase